MVGFLRRFWRSKPEREESADAYQMRLDSFQRVTLERFKSPLTAQMVPLERLKEETDEKLRMFRSSIEELKELSLKMDELMKLLESKEISRNIYNIIKADMSNRIFNLLERLFNLREFLELAKVRAKLEWVNEKIGLRNLENMFGEEYVSRDFLLKSSLSRWEEIINSIDSAFSSLTIDDEITFLSQYLNMVREREPSSEEFKRIIAFCQQRLNELSEMWSTVKRDKIEEIMNMELKISEVKDSIKEVEARYMIGEIDESVYEHRIGVLQGELRKLEEKIEETRQHIDDIDAKIFRCLEILREKS